MKVNLDAKISFTKLISWRLHWLKMDLNSAVKEFDRCFGSEYRNLEVLKSAIEKVSTAYTTFLWEIGAMKEEDVSSQDVRETLKSFLKNTESDETGYRSFTESIELAQNKVLEELTRLHEEKYDKVRTEIAGAIN